jgi:hypothetical protein
MSGIQGAPAKKKARTKFQLNNCDKTHTHTHTHTLKCTNKWDVTTFEK